MRSIVALLALACFCDAKPMMLESTGLHASFGRLGIDNMIIGGSNAAQGHVWRWQLSQQRQGTGGTWAHSCGASLLSSTKALSAAHCLDGATAGILRIIAGLWARSDTSTAQSSDVASFTLHERYQVDTASYSNDIAVIWLSSAISEAGNVQYASLPPDNANNFGGATCTITGWGRTSSSNILPDILQQANIGVLTTQQCTSRMAPVSGVEIWDWHICVYDSAASAGGCNGDSGGPLNCPNGAGGYYVTGVTSFVITDGSSNCLPSYPTVYTRTSAYLAWIASN